MPWTPDPTDEPDEPGTTDNALVAAARTDPAAFADLYERYRPEIHAFVYRRVGDPHRAEDVTSQVFLRAMRGLHTYRSGSFRG
jgi:RNA polymerase sigma-70 factor (ECF subfamily)